VPTDFLRSGRNLLGNSIEVGKVAEGCGNLRCEGLAPVVLLPGQLLGTCRELLDNFVEVGKVAEGRGNLRGEGIAPVVLLPGQLLGACRELLGNFVEVGKVAEGRGNLRREGIAPVVLLPGQLLGTCRELLGNSIEVGKVAEGRGNLRGEGIAPVVLLLGKLLGALSDRLGDVAKVSEILQGNSQAIENPGIFNPNPQIVKGRILQLQTAAELRFDGGDAIGGNLAHAFDFFGALTDLMSQPFELHEVFRRIETHRERRIYIGMGPPEIVVFKLVIPLLVFACSRNDGITQPGTASDPHVVVGERLIDHAHFVATQKAEVEIVISRYGKTRIIRPNRFISGSPITEGDWRGFRIRVERG